MTRGRLKLPVRIKEDKITGGFPVQVPARAERTAATHGLDGRVPLGFRTAPMKSVVTALLLPEEIYGPGSPVHFTASLLIEEFRSCNTLRSEGEEWWAFVRERTHDARGHLFWVALSMNVPERIVSSLELTFGMFVGRGGVDRRQVVPARCDLEPLLWLGDDGLELLRMW